MKTTNPFDAARIELMLSELRLPAIKLTADEHLFDSWFERQPQEVDGFRALSAAFARVSLREPTKLNQLGFGRLKSETELSQPKAQGVLNADSVRSILETYHKVIDIAHQSGFAPQPALHHPFEPKVEHKMKIEACLSGCYPHPRHVVCCQAPE